MISLDYPYRFDTLGRTAKTDYNKHIRDLIEQVLFTSPGERVNRPDFGSGLKQLIFEGNSPELAATVQFLVAGALQQWLGNLIKVDEINVTSMDSTLTVIVNYVVLKTNERKVEHFEQAL